MTMSLVSARGLRAAHDEAARTLSRKTVAELRRIDTAELATHGTERVFGGPVSKDELISDILNLRGYTAEALNEATHVLHHQAEGERWPACGLCQCQETWTAPSVMMPGRDQLMQCVLDPGHRGFCRDDQARERKANS